MNSAVTGAVKWGQNFYQQAGKMLPSLVVAIVVFLVFWLVAYLVGVTINRYSRRKNLSIIAYKLIVKLVRISIIILGLISALGTVGISISALVTSFGLAGLAIGLAFKDILASLLAGVLLVIHHPFSVGDHVGVKGVEGEVVEIDLRFTVLQNGDKHVMIPNAVMLQEAVIVTPFTKIDY